MITYIIILTGLAILWEFITDPGDVTKTDITGAAMEHEGRQMLGAIGDLMERTRIAKALGRCSVCFGFWISIVAAIILYYTFRVNELEAAQIVLITHIAIRIFNRIER